MAVLADKVAVVTGASSGIGFATARAFRDEGAKVFITGRRKDALDAAVAELGPDVTGVVCDASVPSQLDAFYGAVHDRAGRIDVLVANAGVGTAAPFGEVTEDLIDSVFATNVKGTIFTLQQALPFLSTNASVILTGSTAATRPNQGLEVYAASKAAVRTLARGWALSSRAHGFRVNVVSPGGTRTPGLLELITPEMLEQAEGAVPLGRLAEPEEIAAVTTFLASDASSYVNGAEFFADGIRAGVNAPVTAAHHAPSRAALRPRLHEYLRFEPAPRLIKRGCCRVAVGRRRTASAWL
ncbi:SDR family NAD(P)-dependent oxidoreductase [Nocardia sp. NPDC052316]|uniref:SDR family NAD(P)-dependent oxidoreductase n=1 Tax=Nocardia sp. NPDC052316 TaxID=3364329 RepID=UPI0037CAA304